NTKSVAFGLRELRTQGTEFVLNGRKTFFRGTLECCIFPKTGHPPTDVDSWKRIIRIAKGYGLNMIRFHSWCPPEAAFVAADELGFYYQVEAASWANGSSSLGDGKPVDQWLYQETERILKAYGNHPSFVLMPYGNEPGGARHEAYLAKWVSHWKSVDTRRLYTSGAGWPQLAENQFHVTPDPRVQAWGGGLKSRINALPPETRTDYRDYIRQRQVPVISHEIGQWCVYPNFDEISKYTGYLKPKNFEIFRDSLKEHHMGHLARKFLLASGKLQTLCYKEDIESALRTPGMGGFQLLDLHDFPGQGTALVGMLDPFWEDKGYVTAEEFSRFCNQTVPLARMSKRAFTQNERLEAEIEVAHFGPAPLENATTTWKLVADNHKIVARGQLAARSIPVGNCIGLGNLNLDLTKVPAPARYKLVVTVGQGTKPSKESFSNDWDLWVYPTHLNTPAAPDVLLVHDLNDQALAALDAGGKVLLNIPAKRVAGDKLGSVALGFSSIFWNTAWTGRQPPHTLGILCDPKHPALAQFPTDYHSNWQWWYLISRAGAMILDGLPQDLQPTVQVIDDWVTNRKLAMVFEAKIGAGKLLVCSTDLEKDLDRNPVARQLRHSLLSYMASSRFKPAVTVTPEAIRSLMKAPSAMETYGARVIRSDSAHEGYAAENAIDGNPATIWHSAWNEPQPPFPHELQIGFERSVPLCGFTALPRQDGLRNGWIKDYEFYISTDGQNWGEPVAKGTFSGDEGLKKIFLSQPVTARFVRLVAKSGHVNGPWASLAEFAVLTE
ncbi:MAG TPA: discoidin domain-containing protein, partial [Clostridia bacterium]|nr:discoidin domain-containing protein [Clostridia bacterium]